MARLYPLDECLGLTRGILFDTSALIDLFQYEERNGQPSPLLLSIHPNRRYTSIINIFEFICGVSREQVRSRRAWLDDKGFRPRPVTKTVSITFHNLIGDAVSCDLLRDLIVTATAIVEELAVASRDTDFQHIDGILCVAEFTGQA